MQDCWKMGTTSLTKSTSRRAAGGMTAFVVGRGCGAGAESLPRAKRAMPPPITMTSMKTRFRRNLSQLFATKNHQNRTDRPHNLYCDAGELFGAYNTLP